ncbi:hypothetical protein [Mesorhizobium shangrilense]|uniref:Uncharacterized protein n=1 Tax=Mesorhizobium shangrilense TaxID=460060 RepID=A0ABV2DH26_9HYPH
MALRLKTVFSDCLEFFRTEHPQLQVSRKIATASGNSAEKASVRCSWRDVFDLAHQIGGGAGV